MKMLESLAKNKQNSTVRQLLQDFPTQTVSTVTGPIPIKNTRSIYRARSVHNESIGEPIKGFSELVQGLYDFAGEAVFIYSVDSDTISYKVFADAAQKEFAGVLKFPQASLSQTPPAQPELQAV